MDIVVYPIYSHENHSRFKANSSGIDCSVSRPAALEVCIGVEECKSAWCRAACILSENVPVFEWDYFCQRTIGYSNILLCRTNPRLASCRACSMARQLEKELPGCMISGMEYLRPTQFATQAVQNVK
jgi:hypothetical protein